MSNGGRKVKAAWGASKRSTPREAVYEAWAQVVPGEVEPSLFLCFFTPDYSPDEVFSQLNFLLYERPSWRLAGLSTAGIISPRGIWEQGLGLLRISGEGLVVVTSMAKLGRLAAFQAGQEAGEELLAGGVRPPGTIFVFYDGYAEGITPFLWGLYDVLGPDFTYVGGGGGEHFRGKGSVQLTERGWTTGAAVVAGVRGLRTVALAEHGWRPKADPFFITRAEGRIVTSINGFPAREAYLNLVGEKDKSISEIGIAHPLGFPRLTGEFLLRDPLRELPGGAIEFVSEVPFNSAAFLMRAEDLAAVAERVVKKALEFSPKPSFGFIAYCLSQYWLARTSAEEMISLWGEVPYLGFLSFGEVAARGTVPFVQNKTVTVALGRE
ncbi:domain of unknown function DUF1745 [Ammonifex degensii KC4]|uniref:FIST domain-containing protein n=1 Tax=Ammonifex degensii (strain DSM 10501 / KC4) TaxID=429009 RepID=C9RA01_AMMDK|nr:FIST N-terminal domain-containing protein [Ammonifex degensii]ACX53130.1 domain of unknown function DUF1745 [Ammonifex degensii KC4]